MKRLSLAVAAFILIAASLSGCTAQRQPMNGQGRKLQIYVSFYPMYYLASSIAGDKAEVTSLVPAGAEPHDWEPTPQTIKKLQNADMFVYNGAGMETWADRLLDNVDKSRVRIVEASSGIELLDKDPHVWVSPKKYRQQAQNVYKQLAAIDPSNGKYYEDNYNKLVGELDKLDKDITAARGAFKSDVMVVSHEAFGYFAHDYNLKQIAIRGINPEDEPSPAEMAKLVEECKKYDVKYIFFEKLVSPKLSEALANEVGAQVLVLNDAEGLSEEDIKAGKTYITAMYENLEKLKKALM